MSLFVHQIFRNLQRADALSHFVFVYYLVLRHVLCIFDLFAFFLAFSKIDKKYLLLNSSSLENVISFISLISLLSFVFIPKCVNFFPIFTSVSDMFIYLFTQRLSYVYNQFVMILARLYKFNDFKLLVSFL